MFVRKLSHISSYYENYHTFHLIVKKWFTNVLAAKFFLAEKISTYDMKSYIVVSLYFVFLIFIPRKGCFKLALYFLVVKLYVFRYVLGFTNW